MKFLAFSEVFWYSKMNKYGVPRLSKIQKPWKFEILMFKIMKSGFYYTNLKQKKSTKILKVLFKYNFTIKLPKMAIIIMISFPMVFL